MPLGSLVYAVTGNWDHMIHGTTSSNIQPFFCGGRGSIFLLNSLYIYIYTYIWFHHQHVFCWFPGSTGIPKPAYFSRVPAASYQWGGCSRMTVHLSMRCHWDVWIFFTFYEVVGQPSFSYNWSVKGLAIHIEHKGCLAEKWTQWTQEWDSLQTHWCKTYMPPAGKKSSNLQRFQPWSGLLISFTSNMAW